ncbi:MAG: FAD-dependent oxidoreductase [Pseudomonadota bacterium]
MSKSSYPSRRQLLLGAGLALASGCASSGFRISPKGRGGYGNLKPLDLDRRHLTKVTVCTRPFRRAGPRIEVEQVANRQVVHNYGHGGSGWSLSWGSAQVAVDLAMTNRPEVAASSGMAVIGAGVIGMTTAIRLSETGVPVTVYAKDLPMESRSARATGVWSPSSRIALSNVASDDFPDRWERWARRSYASHLQYLGDSGESVAFQPQFYVRNEGGSESVPEARSFAHLHRRLDGLTPEWDRLGEDESPFTAETVRGGPSLAFNVASYSERLTRDFLLRGGKIVRRSFPDLASLSTLSERVIFNCTGYGAKDLFGADDLEPVRGQINWLPPQSHARYGFYYNDVFVISRRDGVAVQFTGANDDYGYGLADETVDDAETALAFDRIGNVYG